MGGGPVTQLAAGLGGAALGRKITGASSLKNFFKQGGSPQKLGELAKDAEQQYWAKSRDLGSKINADARKYVHGLEGLIDEVRDTTAFQTETQRNDLLERLSRYLSDAESGKINAAKLSDRVREINAALPKFQGIANKTPREFIGRAQNLMFNEAEHLGERHPEWLKTWKNARDITKINNFRPEFLSILDDYPKIGKIVTNPILYSVLGGTSGGAIGGLAGTAAGALGASAGLKAAKIGQFLTRSATRKLLGEAVKNTIERNIPQLTKNLTQLNREADKISELKSESRTGFTIERGGLKKR